MSVKQIKNIPFNTSQVFPPQDGVLSGEERIVLQRSAVQTYILQIAKVGFFELPSLLIQIVASLVLVVVARLLTDYFAFYMVRQRWVYRQFRHIETFRAKDLPITEGQIKELKGEDKVNGTLSRLESMSKQALAAPNHERPGCCASTFDGPMQWCLLLGDLRKENEKHTSGHDVFSDTSNQNSDAEASATGYVPLKGPLFDDTGINSSPKEGY